MLKNLKKVISTIAAVAILATSASAFAVTFPDVDESASYAGAVELLTALGVVNGDDNGKFNPDNTVTRAEFAKMVVEALGQGEAAAKSSYTKFADAQGHWAAGYIEAGVAAEFINGYDETTFGPDDTVTYAQAVKMLVGAAGYEAWAQQAGGWTAGYMSYGSSLDITAGVKGVTNDTALTRAQCAVLIANAMKAPLLVTNGYNHVGTMNGVVMVPNYVQMDGEGEYWKSMLTEYHNAYDVMGRVSGTAKTTAGVEKDEVQFTVEDAKNLDNAYIADGSEVNRVVKFGTTNANDMMFEYASAVLVKDEDTDEFTIAYIETYGATKTVELSAKAVTGITSSAVTVLKNEMTSDVKTYDVASGATVYVNGVVTTGSMAAYIGDNNAFGTVTLVDQSEPGTTVTDGNYDAIMITKTVSEMVGYTEARRSANVIELASGNRFSYDPEDEDATIVFTMDGAEIAFEDLQEDDVLTITVAPEDMADLTNLTAANVVVTRNTVAGTVTRVSDDTVVVDGAEYDIVAGLITDPDGAVGPLKADVLVTKEYTFYLDANGVIVASDELDANVNYGIVIKRWTNAEGDDMMRLITADGETVTYEVKAGEFLGVFGSDQTAGAGTPTTDDDVYTVTGWDYADVVADPSDAVVAYKLSSGKIKAGEPVSIEADGSLVFKANTAKLGGYKLDESATKILDLSAYLMDEEEDAAVMTVDMFEDDVDYTAVVVDRNSSKTYNFVVVLDGVGNTRATSDLAMVKKYVGATQVDEEDVFEYVVLKNGEEATLYTPASLVEGQVIMYPATSKAWVATGLIDTIFTPGASYEDMMTAVLGSGLTLGTKVTDAAAVAAEVVMYTGVAYDANLTDLALIDTFTAGVSATADVEDLSIDGANIYTYDFKNLPDKGYRVEAAASSSAPAKFQSIADAAMNTITWAGAEANEVCAPIVIVREIENEVTDVFYFVGEWTE